MGRKPLSSKEDVLRAIHRWLVERGVPPTIRELRDTLKVGSSRTVLRYLSTLETEREIKRWPGARGIRLLRSTRRGMETVRIPLVGEAPAGPLMTAEQNIEGWIRLPKDFMRPPANKFYLLRVRGDSMNKAAIDDERIENGDLVLVRQQSVAEPGNIVVALIDGEVTIKRLASGPGYYFLKPESTNSEHRAILVGKKLVVQGVVNRVLKKGSELMSLIED
jgi:repressor LexA